MDDIYSRAMAEHPDEPEDAIRQGVDQLKASLPGASDDEILEAGRKAKQDLGAAPAQPQGIQNPLVKDHIQKLYGDKFSDSARQKLVDENAADASGPNWTAGLAALGAGLQGRDAAAAGQSHLKMQQGARDAKLSDFDKGRETKLADYKQGRQMTADDETDANAVREKDPNSVESKLAQDLAISMGMKPELVAGLTASKFKSFSPVMQKKYEIEQRNLDRKEQRADRNALFGEKKAERDEAKAQKRDDLEKSLAIPGYARTGEVLPKAEEAAKLRTAVANADQMQSKLKRMTELVKDNGSFEYGGKGGAEMESLATEIQLLSKSPEMYQLGVLSGPDMKLLEKIASDPTSLGSMFTRDSTRQKQIETQMKSIANKLSSVTKASGYRPEGQIAQGGSDDETAIKWAKQNPKDPRAKNILEINGINTEELYGR